MDNIIDKFKLIMSNVDLGEIWALILVIFFIIYSFFGLKKMIGESFEKKLDRFNNDESSMVDEIIVWFKKWGKDTIKASANLLIIFTIIILAIIACLPYLYIIYAHLQ